MPDIIIIMILLLAIVMGAHRGLRSGLYIMTALLSITLVVLLLTAPMERIILNFAGIGPEKYPDAPPVAVLILEGKIEAAYVAALLPLFISFFLLLGFGFLAVRTGRRRRGTKTGISSRIFGATLGFCAGFLLILLFSAQLLRLPWPLANQMFRESLIISTLNHIARPILSVMAGSS